MHGWANCKKRKILYPTFLFDDFKMKKKKRNTRAEKYFQEFSISVCVLFGNTSRKEENRNERKEKKSPRLGLIN